MSIEKKNLFRWLIVAALSGVICGCSRVQVVSEDGAQRTFLTGPFLLISEHEGEGRIQSKKVSTSGFGITAGPQGTTIGLYRGSIHYLQPQCSIHVWVTKRTDIETLKNLLNSHHNICIEND